MKKRHLQKENNDLCSANLENKQFVTETEHVVKEDNYNKTKFFDKKLEQVRVNQGKFLVTFCHSHL